jgi:tRNA(fMet)-specific endonuclease VapC
VERVILDTGVLVAAVRGQASLPDDADISIPAICVAEFLAGVQLDADVSRQAAQRAFLGEVLTVVPVVDYDRSIAEHHAGLLAHTARAGAARGAHDLIIAATARATDRVVITTDARAHFEELLGVVARIV